MKEKQSEDHDFKIAMLAGVISFIYFFTPVFQHLFFIHEADRVNDHVIFVLSMNIFQSILIISHGTIIPYIVQFMFFLLGWLILFGTVKITIRIFRL